MVVPWWCVIVVDSSDLDLDVVVENGDEKTLRTVDVYHVGISNEFGGNNNQLMLEAESWEHQGCSWILQIAGKSLPDPIWCSEKPEYYTPNLRSVPLPFGE